MVSMSQKECQAYANEKKLVYVDVDSSFAQHYPPGCSQDADGVYHNPEKTSYSCAPDEKCLCKETPTG